MNKRKRSTQEISDCSSIGYIIIALFFGGLGIHNFYAKRNTKACFQFLIGITMVGLFVTLIWALSDIISVRTDGAGREFK